MEESADFYRTDFQDKVYHQFEFLKGFKAMRGNKLADGFIEKVKIGKLSDKFWGCLFIPIFKVLDILGTRTLLKHSEKYRYQENEKIANELLAQSEIREILCSALHKVSGKEILTEERMVKTVVDSLRKEDVRNKFSIPLDETLFAFLSYKLLQKGLENYCPSKS